MSRQTSHGFKSFDKKTLLGVLEVGVQKVHVGMNPPFGPNQKVVKSSCKILAFKVHAVHAEYGSMTYQA